MCVCISRYLFTCKAELRPYFLYAISLNYKNEILTCHEIFFEHKILKGYKLYFNYLSLLECIGCFNFLFLRNDPVMSILIHKILNCISDYFLWIGSRTGIGEGKKSKHF